jgi:radical SAM protein with 4Fe4S-binding SPASM domain
LNFCITNHCNQNCIHCYINPNQEIYNELNKEIIKEIFISARNLGLKSIHIFGGEPFLRSDLKEICEFFYNNEIRISIATNGLFLNDENISWIKKYKVFLTVSVHGTREIHDKICNNPGSFDITVKNIISLKRANIDFAITTCINKMNLKTYFNLLNEFYHKNIRKFIILYFSPIGRGINLTKEIVSNKEWENFILEIGNFRNNNKLDELDLSYEMSVFKRDYVNYFTYSQDDKACNLESNVYVIDCNGDIYPCILLLRDKRFFLGNVRGKGLGNILKVDIQEVIKKSTKLSNHCLDCSLVSLCKGGCIAYRDNKYLDFRCDPNKKNYLLFCPLYTNKLY